MGKVKMFTCDLHFLTLIRNLFDLDLLSQRPAENDNSNNTKMLEIYSNFNLLESVSNVTLVLFMVKALTRPLHIL